MTTPMLVRRHSRVLHQDLAGEEGTVLLHLDTGAYHALTPVAARIWELLSSPCTEEEIRERLEREFEVEPAVLRDDVARFLAELRERGLIRNDRSP